MQLVTADFESFFSDTYTLRSKDLSTSEYVRDPRFEAISVAIKIDKKPTKVYFGPDIKSALDKIDWSKSTLLCHHTQFDGLILSHHYGHVPAVYACTLSMAKALFPKVLRNDLGTVAIRYGKQNKLEMPDFKGKHLADLTPEEIEAVRVYNARDVDVTYEIYHEMLKVFPAKELELVDIIIRMFADPVLRVDMKLAKSELDRERAEREAAVLKSGHDVKVLRSDKMFPVALAALGADVPMKPSPSIEGKMIPAIAKSDEDFDALLYHPNQKVVDLVKGRLSAKSSISETRAARMLIRGRNRMRLPIYYNFSGAHTHRMSGGDKFNPTNFKQAHKSGGSLRRAILPPPGYEIVVVDASQIEARVTAWLAGEEWLLNAFREKRDPYCEFGPDVYQRTITKADKEERFVLKTAILGLGFQMGGPKLQKSLLVQSINQGLDPVRMPLEVCYSIVYAYRRKCAKIADLWKYLNDVCIGAMISGRKLEWKGLTFGKEHVVLPNGLKLLYPGLRGNVVEKSSRMIASRSSVQDASYDTLKGRSKIYGGLFCENLAQALARIIVMDVLIKLAKKYRAVMTTYDEIAFIAKKKEAEKAFKYATELMSMSPTWAPDLPLASEGGHDVCYSK